VTKIPWKKNSGHLSYHRTQNLHRIESLYPKCYPVTAAALGRIVKEKSCRIPTQQCGVSLWQKSVTEYSKVTEQFHKLSGVECLDNYVICEEGLGE
jgi:hypothetical protein